MKQKLTQTNFGMGETKVVSYFTTNKTHHSPMKGEYFTHDQRREKKNLNSMTNFIA